MGVYASDFESKIEVFLHLYKKYLLTAYIYPRRCYQSTVKSKMGMVLALNEETA